MQRRTEHPRLAPLVERLQIQSRPLRATVDGRDGARLDDAGQIEELIVLAECLLAWTLGRALHDRDRIADAFDQASAPGAEFLERKNLCPAEYRLRRQRGETREDTQNVGDGL
jgi:hypothetical protein